MRSSEYKIYSMTITVPAGASDVAVSKIIPADVAYFRCKSVKGTFTTLVDNAGVVNDSGVNTIGMKIVDTGRDRQYMDNYVPCDILLQPGRVKTAAAANVLTADPVNPVFLALPFDVDLSKSFEVRFRNSGNYAQTVTVTFEGTEFYS